MRPPDRIIGVDYLHRWHVIPRNPLFNIYLHKFIGSDDDRALHDHPWWSVSFLLKGGLLEVSPMLHGWQHWRRIKRFVPVIRRPTFSHRLIVAEGPVWTLFITGPVVRAWGFLCPKGWVHHKDLGSGCE